MRPPPGISYCRSLSCKACKQMRCMDSRGMALSSGLYDLLSIFVQPRSGSASCACHRPLLSPRRTLSSDEDCQSQLCWRRKAGMDTVGETPTAGRREHRAMMCLGMAIRYLLFWRSATFVFSSAQTHSLLRPPVLIGSPSCSR